MGIKREDFWKKFPLLYSDRNASIRESLIPFGLDIGDGWLPLVWELSEKLEVMIQKIADENPDMRCRYCRRKKSEHDDNVLIKVPLKRGLHQRYNPDIWWKFVFNNGKRGISYLLTCLRNKAKRNIHNILLSASFWVFDKLKIGKKVPLCNEYKPELPQASQVKSKFAELRFYMTSATDEMYDLIDEYTDKSTKICELCGAPGEIRDGGWLETLCNKCYTPGRKK